MRGVKFVSWGDNTGYAIAGRAYVRALIDAGVNLTWTPMLPGQRTRQACTSSDWPCAKLARVCNRQIDYDTVVIHSVPDHFEEWIARERKPGRRILGYTVWELDQLPDAWPGILNQLDGVIVPCRWNAEVFRRCGVRVPIHVVPHLSQFEEIEHVGEDEREAVRQRLNPATRTSDLFTFYTVGVWSNRKSPGLVLQAYLQAFSANDPVHLVLKTSALDVSRTYRHWRNGFRRHHPPTRRTVARMLSRLRAAPSISLIDDESLSDGQLLALHETGDCFVSLTRTEGWGMGAFEAARLGKPVIMTGYGGQLDFLDPQQAHLVDYRMIRAEERGWGFTYRPTDLWAEPSVEHAAALMREVFEQREEARTRAARLAQRVAREFSCDATTGALLRALKGEAGA